MRSLGSSNLRRTAGRFLLRRSPAGQKLGRGLTSGPNDELIRHLEDVFRSLRVSAGWRKQFLTILGTWIADGQDHAKTSSALLGIQPERNWIPEKALVIAQVCATVGLFEVALAFEEWAADRIRQSHKSPRSPKDLIELIQVAIHSADLDAATEFAHRLTATLTGHTSVPFGIRDVLNYVRVWAGEPTSLEPTGTDHAAQEAMWQRMIRDRQVVIYGPGTVSPTHRNFTRGELVARIAGPGSYTWHETNDLAQGRTDIVYLIPETLESIVSTNSDHRELLQRYGIVCVKKSLPLHLSNGRRVEPGSRLFLRGHPNMVPLICVDLIRVPGATGYVVGSDFFSSASSYRRESRRVTELGVPQSVQGSNGKRFDRTTLMASHNVFQNRRIVINLVESGRISGDDNFLSACALSDVDYAKRLDSLYGQHKI